MSLKRRLRLWIPLLFLAVAVAFYLVSGSPEPVGEAAGRVVKVTAQQTETEGRPEILVALDRGGESVRLTVERGQAPDEGDRVLLMEYRSPGLGSRSFTLLQVLEPPEPQ
jgi:hypothetical protein